MTTTETWWGLSPEAWAAVFAFAAFMFSLYTFIEQKRGEKRLKHLEALQSNGAMLNEAWRQLAVAPTALRFHSIDKNEVEKSGFTVDELVYLIINFQAADYYYQHKEGKMGAFSTGSLRYAILANPETRRAWPFMKPFFVASDRYVHRIEETIRLFDLLQQTGTSVDAPKTES